MSIRNVCDVLGLSLVAAVLAGCNGSGTLPVTGKVTKGGQPVAGANVMFHPQSEGGQTATGTTDDAGVYKLTTFVNGDGAIPGTYNVTIMKFPSPAAPAPAASGGGTSQADIDAAYAAAEAAGQNPTNPEAAPVQPPPKNELDSKFASPNTSGLTAEVKPGSTEFDFDVTGGN